MEGGVDLTDPASILDPTAYFARAREAGGPVQWSDRHRAWMLLTHAECAEAFRDGERLSADRVGPLERAAATQPAAFGKVVELLSGWMVFRDPPAHTHLREPVRGVFTPRRMAGLAGLIGEVVDQVLDDLDAEHPAGEVIDFQEAFAAPLPALVVAAILGVDPDDRHRFRAWSDGLASIVFSTTPKSTPPEPAMAAAADFTAFFEALIERERREPSGSILSLMIGEAGDELSDMELVGACTLLLFAGHETTTQTLMSATGELLRRPDLLAWWRDHPEADETAVSEFLRVVGPARSMVRKVATPHDRGGQRLEPGQNVIMCIQAANHDPAVFDQPEVLDLERDPNHHLGFGWGLHHCLGSHLALLETRLALRAFLDRHPVIEPAGDLRPLSGNMLGLGYSQVHLRLGR